MDNLPNYKLIYNSKTTLKLALSLRLLNIKWKSSHLSRSNVYLNNRDVLKSINSKSTKVSNTLSFYISLYYLNVDTFKKINFTDSLLCLLKGNILSSMFILYNCSWSLNSNIFSADLNQKGNRHKSFDKSWERTSNKKGPRIKIKDSKGGKKGKKYVRIFWKRWRKSFLLKNKLTSKRSKNFINKLSNLNLRSNSVSTLYSKITNTRLRLNSVPKPKLRNKITLSNSKFKIRNPKSYKYFRNFFVSTSSKLNNFNSTDIIDLKRNNKVLYSSKSLSRSNLISSNLKALSLLGLDNIIGAYNIDSYKKSHLTKKILNLNAFLLRFLVNPSIDVVSKSFLAKKSSVRPDNSDLSKPSLLRRYSLKDQNDLIFKRSLIFFINRFLNNSSFSSNLNRFNVLNKLLKSSISNFISDPDNVSFNSKWFMSSLMLRNYISSRWENRKLIRKKKRIKRRKRYRIRIGLNYKIKSLALSVLSSINPTIFNLSKPSHSDKKIYMFFRRLTFKLIQNSIKNLVFLKSKYNKKRFNYLSLNNLNNKELHNLKSIDLTTIESLVSNDLTTIKSNMFKSQIFSSNTTDSISKSTLYPNLNSSDYDLILNSLPIKNANTDAVRFHTFKRHIYLKLFKTRLSRHTSKKVYHKVKKRKKRRLYFRKKKTVKLLHRLFSKLNSKVRSPLFNPKFTGHLIKFKKPKFSKKRLRRKVRRLKLRGYNLRLKRSRLVNKFNLKSKNCKVLLSKRLPVIKFKKRNVNLYTNSVSSRLSFSKSYLTKRLGTKLNHSKLNPNYLYNNYMNKYLKKKKLINKAIDLNNDVRENPQYFNIYSNILLKKSTPKNFTLTDLLRTPSLSHISAFSSYKALFREFSNFIDRNKRFNKNYTIQNYMWKNVAFGSKINPIRSKRDRRLILSKKLSKVRNYVVNYKYKLKRSTLSVFKRKNLLLNYKLSLLKPRWKYKVSHLKRLFLYKLKLSKLSKNNIFHKKLRSYNKNLNRISYIRDNYNYSSVSKKLALLSSYNFKKSKVFKSKSKRLKRFYRNLSRRLFKRSIRSNFDTRFYNKKLSKILVRQRARLKWYKSIIQFKVNNKLSLSKRSLKSFNNKFFKNVSRTSTKFETKLSNELKIFKKKKKMKRRRFKKDRTPIEFKLGRQIKTKVSKFSLASFFRLRLKNKSLRLRLKSHKENKKSNNRQFVRRKRKNLIKSIPAFLSSRSIDKDMSYMMRPINPRRRRLRSVKRLKIGKAAKIRINSINHKSIKWGLKKIRFCPKRIRNEPKLNYFINKLNKSIDTKNLSGDLNYNSISRLSKRSRGKPRYFVVKSIKRSVRLKKKKFINTKLNLESLLLSKRVKRSRIPNIIQDRKFDSNFKKFLVNLTNSSNLPNSIKKITKLYLIDALRKKNKSTPNHNYKRTRFKPRLVIKRLHKSPLNRRLMSNWKGKKYSKFKSMKYSRLKKFKWFRLKKTKSFFRKSYLSKQYSRYFLKPKLTRSFIRKDFIRQNVPQGNLSFLYNMNKDLLRNPKLITYSYDYLNLTRFNLSSYKALLSRLVSTYNLISNYNLSTKSLVDFKLTLPTLRLPSISPLPYNYFNLNLNLSIYVKYPTTATPINDYSMLTFSKFVFKYLSLVNQFKDINTSTFSLMNIEASNSNTLNKLNKGKSSTPKSKKRSNRYVIFSKGKKLRRRLFKSNVHSKKSRLKKRLYRTNSYNSVTNLLSNHIGNPNLYLRSFDLLRFALNKRRYLNKAASFITNKLWYEFRRLEASFFIDEVVSLILSSLKFKDTNIFMSWFVRFMYKLPIKKHKKVLAFLKKLFRVTYNSTYKNKLRFSGVYFDIRGKVGVTGSKKKRHTCIAYGNRSNTNRRLKLVSQKEVVVTTTGVLGVTFSIFY